MHVIEFEQVDKVFAHKKALRGVSFAIPEGQVIGLIGPSGSGKTTALRLILNLLAPTRGEVRVFGQPPSERVADRIGYLPEERGLYPRMSVREAARYYARLKGVDPSERTLRAWLERLDMAAHADTPVGALSKGTAQKAQFVATVLHEPHLLVLDEPCSGLDPLSQQLMSTAIASCAGQGRSVLLSTHDLAWAERMCTSVVMLHQGRKVLDGSVRAEPTAQRASIKVAFGGALPSLGELPGVIDCQELGNYRRLSLAPDADPQRILWILAQHGELSHFELEQPSLHDTFLELAALRLESVPPGARHV
ncbi:MAG: hypothetical protein RL685_6512 [Pseudomonadota bacterium]